MHVRIGFVTSDKSQCVYALTFITSDKSQCLLFLCQIDKRALNFITSDKINAKLHYNMRTFMASL